MSPDLPDKLLGISLDEPDERRAQDDGDDEDLERFVFFEHGEHRLALDVDDVATITDSPAELTRVPRSPSAVEGVMDLRGEITAVVDLRTHFPVDEEPSADRRLVVFDRPNDQQSAAIRVDDVHGVETVPASNVLDEDGVASRDVSGRALEHPLVTAIVATEHHPDVDDVVSRDALTDPDEAGSSDDASAVRSQFVGASAQETVGTEFDAGDGSNQLTDEREDDEADVVLEETPLLDVERLLLASGQTQ